MSRSTVIAYLLTSKCTLIQFSPASPSTTFLYLLPHHLYPTLITMSDYYCRHSQTPPGRAGDISDEPMSPPERAQRCTDKKRVPCTPSPCCPHSPSREGQHKKRCHVTVCDASPPSDQWCFTATGLLAHDQDPRCTTCLEYQKHVSMDIVLETPSIMAACKSALRCLSRLFGRSGREAALEDNLIAMCHECNYWHRCAEDAEKASDFSQKQASAAFEQARLLSMYIPSTRPEDTPGVVSRTKHVWYSEHGMYCRFEIILERVMSATHIAVIPCMRTHSDKEEFLKK